MWDQGYRPIPGLRDTLAQGMSRTALLALLHLSMLSDKNGRVTSELPKHLVDGRSSAKRDAKALAELEATGHVITDRDGRGHVVALSLPHIVDALGGSLSH